MAQLSPRDWKRKQRAIDRRLRELIYPAEAFARDDERPDPEFYRQERLVPHLDARASATVEQLVGSLVIEQAPAMLDLMASWDSHIPEQVKPSRVVGLGLNADELDHNPVLTERLVHDLNAEPTLPFSDESFDVVLNTVSVEYLTRPFEVFREVGRILRPGGLVLVSFSNRMFPEKTVAVWSQASDQERLMIVEDILRMARCFTRPRLWLSQGLRRPASDRYAHLGLPSDPVFAVAAERIGGPDRERPFPGPPVPVRHSPEEVEQRKHQVGSTLRCPHCDEPLHRQEVHQTPYTTWSSDTLYVCLNDECPLLVKGWQTMCRQRLPGSSYRLLYDPERDRCSSLPVTSLQTL